MKNILANIFGITTAIGLSVLVIICGIMGADLISVGLFDAEIITDSYRLTSLSLGILILTFMSGVILSACAEEPKK